MPLTPGQTTLLQVRTAARERSDQVNSQFLTDAEFNANIQASQQELYGIIVQKYGNDYYLAGTPDNWYQFTTTATATSYALPDGSSTYKLQDTSTTAPAFWKLLGVDLQLGSAANGWITLKQTPFIERNRLNGPYAQLAYGLRTQLKYRLAGDRLWLTPQPASGQVVRIFYVPRITVASGDSDVIDGVNGWEEYLVIDAAIKALQKEESDCSLLMAQKSEMLKRLESEAENRDAGQPPVVGNARRRSFDGDYGDGEWM